MIRRSSSRRSSSLVVAAARSRRAGSRAAAPALVAGIGRGRVRRHRARGGAPRREPGEVAHRHRRVGVVGQPDPVDQVVRPEVLADGGPTGVPGADGHRRRQVGLDAGAAEAVADVHRDPEHVAGDAELEDGRRVGRVHGRRVAGAADAQHGPRRLDARGGAGHADQPQERRQLLAGERLLGHHLLELRDQHLRVVRHLDACLLRQPGGGLAHDRRVEPVVGEDEVADQHRPARRRAGRRRRTASPG